jgi:hypothetical protein
MCQILLAAFYQQPALTPLNYLTGKKGKI